LISMNLRPSLACKHHQVWFKPLTGKSIPKNEASIIIRVLSHCY